MATVSLCMIVKNEEAVLARCLESVKDAVDEIILVDTGSTDRTKAIAAEYTDKIFDFAWRDDFSAARNFSFSKATMEYAMWMDADDVLTKEDREAFIAFKEAIPSDADAVMMKYNTAFDEEGKPTFFYYRERLIKRSIPYTWKGRIHEAIVHSGRTMHTEIAITHQSVKKSYSDRNLKIYEKQIADGEELTPRDLFYYGRELYYHKHWDQAILVLTRFLNAKNGWLENNIEACKILSYCYGEKGDTAAAMDALTKSFQYDIPRAEICCELGRRLMQEGRYVLAIFWYQLALNAPRNDSGGAFVSVDCYGYIPAIQLCVCYDRIGDVKRAEEYNELAGSFRPLSAAYLSNKEYFKNRAEKQA